MVIITGSDATHRGLEQTPLFKSSTVSVSPVFTVASENVGLFVPRVVPFMLHTNVGLVPSSVVMAVKVVGAVEQYTGFPEMRTVGRKVFMRFTAICLELTETGLAHRALLFMVTQMESLSFRLEMLARLSADEYTFVPFRYQSKKGAAPPFTVEA